MKRFISLFVVTAMLITTSIPALAFKTSEETTMKTTEAVEGEISEDVSDAADITDNSGEASDAADITDNSGEANNSEEHNNGFEYDPYSNLPSFLRPNDQLYKVFIDILKLYTKEHLYEFTEEEVLYKFIYDMIKYHPENFEMMIDTMLGTMDPYSAYHTPNSGFLSLESESAGYGITVSDSENGVLIEKVSPQSEAEKAGIFPGDVIVGVFGYDTTKLPWYLLSLLLKRPYFYISEKGEDNKYPDYNPPILLTIDRNGEILNFTLKKGLVITDELSTKYLHYDDNDIAYISIASFIGDNLSANFLKEIERFKADGYTKLVIDLRNNGGGATNLAIEMSEIFVDNGETMCYFNDKNMKEPMAVISDTDKIEFDSISVLVNEHTASAAELMANILRNKAGAVLVGKKTFGKAIGQTIYNFTSGSSISITTYEALDCNGESYNGEGLHPDLELDNVEMLYVLPELEVFNHVNYLEIEYGVYSEPCLALEKRLSIMGFLKESAADGIWDGATSLAIYFLQRTYFTSEWTGGLNNRTVTLITDIINGYKDDTYLEDSQLDCALLYHSSLDQSRRLIKEKENLAKKQAKLIEENKKKLEAEAELEDALLN